MSTNNTKPESKELTPLKFVQNKLGENLWQFPQRCSQSTIFEFMEEFAQLSPSDHTAPQEEEELRNRAESYATELVRIVICDEVEEDIASDDEVIEKYKDEWSIAADAYLAGAKGKTAKDLRNNH